MSPTCTNSHYDNHATFVPSINHNKDVALLWYVVTVAVPKVVEHESCVGRNTEKWTYFMMRAQRQKYVNSRIL